MPSVVVSATRESTPVAPTSSPVHHLGRCTVTVDVILREADRTFFIYRPMTDHFQTTRRSLIPDAIPRLFQCPLGKHRSGNCPPVDSPMAQERQGTHARRGSGIAIGRIASIDTQLDLQECRRDHSESQTDCTGTGDIAPAPGYRLDAGAAGTLRGVFETGIEREIPALSRPFFGNIAAISPRSGCARRDDFSTSICRK